MISVELVNMSKSLLNVSLVDQFGLRNTLQLLTYREMLRLGQNTGSDLYLAFDLLTTFFFVFMRDKKKNVHIKKEKHSITHGQTEITDVHLNYIHNMLLCAQTVSRQYINVLKSVCCFKSHVLKHVNLATEILC